MAIAVEELKGRVPVRAMGSEPRSVEEMVRFIQQADAAGVDAVHIYSIEPGHGYVPNAAEIEAYLRVALDATTKPAVLSSHMSVGYMIPHDVLDRLVDDYPNIIGIVISSMFEMRYLFDVIDRHEDRLEVISGGGLHGLLNLTFGGAGFATTEANIAPRLAVSIIDHFKVGDAHAMLAASRLLTELSIRNTWYRDNASSVMAALAALGSASREGCGIAHRCWRLDPSLQHGLLGVRGTHRRPPRAGVDRGIDNGQEGADGHHRQSRLYGRTLYIPLELGSTRGFGS